jgi:hypothetical protein
MAAVFAVGLIRPAWAEDVDGHYKGTYSNTGQCIGGGQTEFVIKGRTFTRRFGPGVQFEVTVGPDGSFTSQNGQSALTGVVKNGHADLTITAGRGNCTVHQTLDKT